MSSSWFSSHLVLPILSKNCHVMGRGGGGGGGRGALPVSPWLVLILRALACLRELRSFSIIPHLSRDMRKSGASKWTQIVVRHPALRHPALRKGQAATAGIFQCHRRPMTWQTLLFPNYFQQISFPLCYQVCLPCVGDSGKWARIAMSSSYCFPFILVFTVFSLCKTKFLTKKNAIQSWSLSKM